MKGKKHKIQKKSRSVKNQGKLIIDATFAPRQTGIKEYLKVAKKRRPTVQQLIINN